MRRKQYIFEWKLCARVCYNKEKGEKCMKKYDVKDFTLDEKLSLLTGRDMWRTHTANGKLPELWLSDGPHGLRKIEGEQTRKATAMPNLSVLANTWNPELAVLEGRTIADDCIEQGVDILLAPGVNIKRTPLCGRNFEYFSEDPLLAGVMGKAYIQGVQAGHIGTSLKHFCANNREYDRSFQTSEIDERTLREIYLTAFEIALEGKPWTVMCSYNPVNGVYPSESKWLLQEILRGEFGFDGVIVSDWGAVHSSWRATKATLDLRMPGWEQTPPEFKVALEKGLLLESEVDFCAQNMLNLIAKKQDADEKKKVQYTVEERHQNAVQIAKEGIVLLKNDDGVLPITGGSVTLFGKDGQRPVIGGMGSAHVQTNFKQTPMKELLENKLGVGQVLEDGVMHDWSEMDFIGLKQAYEHAYETDKVVLFVHPRWEGEGMDRTTLRLTGPVEEAIRNFSKYNENIVVCIYAGSAVDMSEWIDYVKGVVYVGYAGEGVNEALCSILTGETSPSGKLAETFPICLEDTYCEDSRGDGLVEIYDDGVFVGYRYYDTFGVDVQFPFGHGLSYAEFEYSNLAVKKIGETDYEISYDIKNISDVDGKEISEVYVKDVFCMVSRPEKELKGFSKDLIKAGETKRVTVRLNFRSFAYYSLPLKRWHVENGWFEILVGSSSRDIRLQEKIKICLPDDEQSTTRNI